MAHLSNIFHHFAFTHPQSDPSLLDAPRDAADNIVLSLKVDFREYTSAYFLEVELRNTKVERHQYEVAGRKYVTDPSVNPEDRSGNGVGRRNFPR
jgi:hypothetical protein